MTQFISKMLDWLELQSRHDLSWAPVMKAPETWGTAFFLQVQAIVNDPVSPLTLGRRLQGDIHFPSAKGILEATANFGQVAPASSPAV